MLLGLILFEIVLCTACNNVLLVKDVVMECFSQTDKLRLELAISIRYEREHVSAASILQRAVLVKLVKNDIRIGILLELDDDTYLFVTVGFIS